MTDGIQVVLFDLGGTLIYFDGHWPDVLLKANQALFLALEGAGVVVPKNDFVTDFRTRLEAYYTERETEFIEHTTAYILRATLAAWGHPQVSETALRQAIDALYAISQAHWKTEPLAATTLQALQTQGYRLGLISNAGDDTDVQTLVDQAGLRSYFDVILSSAALGIRKPNPRIFQTALQHWEAHPTEAVMVGDTLGADILGAQNAGVFSIWITRWANTPANRAHQETIHPDATIEHLGELTPLLEQLGEKHPRENTQKEL